ncbi:MAG: hypothetical protein ACTSUV_04560 [Candidatus Ranarchaeia archaeon]
MEHIRRLSLNLDVTRWTAIIITIASIFILLFWISFTGYQNIIEIH